MNQRTLLLIFCIIVSKNLCGQLEYKPIIHLLTPELIANNKIQKVIIEGDVSVDDGLYKKQEIEFDENGLKKHAYYISSFSDTESTVGYFFEKGKTINIIYANPEGRETKNVKFEYKNDILLKKTIHKNCVDIEEHFYYDDKNNLTNTERIKEFCNGNKVNTIKTYINGQIDSLYQKSSFEEESYILKYEANEDTLTTYRYSLNNQLTSKSVMIFNKDKVPIMTERYYYKIPTKEIKKQSMTKYFYNEKGLISKVQNYYEFNIRKKVIYRYGEKIMKRIPVYKELDSVNIMYEYND